MRGTVEREEAVTIRRGQSPLIVKSSNLRLREEGDKIFIQVFSKGLNEFQVEKDYVKRMISEFSLPDNFWDLLSNESIVSVANDYLLSKENENGSVELIFEDKLI